MSHHAPQATVSEGLAQGPYVAARFEPMTLQTKGYESTNEPPCPTIFALLQMCQLWHHVSHPINEKLLLPYMRS